MKLRAVPSIVFVAVVVVAASSGAACKKKGFASRMCLSADGTSQDCGIGCTIEKDQEACARWEQKTKDLCPKLTKAQCQEICDKDQNPTACTLAKAMK